MPNITDYYINMYIGDLIHHLDLVFKLIEEKHKAEEKAMKSKGRKNGST